MALSAQGSPQKHRVVSKSDELAPDETKSGRRAAKERLDSKKRSSVSTATKVLGLFALIPAVLSVPWFLNVSSEKLLGRQHYLIYVWMFFVLIELFVFFYWRKTTTTWNSFLTQNLIWMIFTLGVYSLLNLPQFFPIHLRQIALYLWCTLTMTINLLVFFVDDTDYKEEERRELRKEEKRKVCLISRMFNTFFQKREEELRKKEKWDEDENEFERTFSKRTRVLINLAFYVVILLFVCWFSYKVYRDVTDRMHPNQLSEEQFDE